MATLSTAATTMPTAMAVSLLAQLASQSIRAMPLSTSISAPTARAKAAALPAITCQPMLPRLVCGVRGDTPSRGSILPYSFGTKNRVGSRQNKMPENKHIV